MISTPITEAVNWRDYQSSVGKACLPKRQFGQVIGVCIEVIGVKSTGSVAV